MRPRPPHPAPRARRYAASVRAAPVRAAVPHVMSGISTIRNPGSTRCTARSGRSTRSRLGPVRDRRSAASPRDGAVPEGRARVPAHPRGSRPRAPDGS